MNIAILFNAVISGVVSSSYALRVDVSAAGDYAALLDRATLLANEVDASIPAGGYFEYHARMLMNIVNSVCFQRNLVGSNPNYSGIKNDILGMWNAAVARLVAYPSPQTYQGGTTAARPIAAAPYTTYWNTTTNALDIWDGAVWRHAFPAGYDDLQGEITQATAVAGLTLEEYRDTPIRKYWFARNQDDSLNIAYQMRHNWMMNAVEPHIHLIPASPTDGTVVIQGRYAWSSFDALALPTWGGWTTFRVTKFLQGGAKQWLPQAVSLGTIVSPLAAMVPSAILEIWIQRPGASDPADTYEGNKPDHTAAANLGISYADCHIQVAGLYS